MSLGFRVWGFWDGSVVVAAVLGLVVVVGVGIIGVVVAVVFRVVSVSITLYSPKELHLTLSSRRRLEK